VKSKIIIKTKTGCQYEYIVDSEEAEAAFCSFRDRTNGKLGLVGELGQGNTPKIAAIFDIIMIASIEIVRISKK
jgi:hypothetical protein